SRASGQKQDYNAYGLKSVPNTDPAYKNAAFLSDHYLLTGCPADYFNGQRLLTRYEFALNVDRIFKDLKTRLLDIPEAFPGTNSHRGTVGGVTLEELGVLKRLYTEF